VPRALIFDLDGTLVESLPGIATALNRSLAAHHLPTHGEQAVRRFIGNGSWKLCQRGAPGEPKDVVDALERQFFEEYKTAWREGTHPFAGIVSLLNALCAASIPLAVFSNKPHEFTVDIVAALFPKTPFASVLGHRADTPRKPDPAGALEIAKDLQTPPDDICFVGDSTVDYDTAVNAGMQPLLVDWGYHDRQALEATGAPVLTAVDQVLPALGVPHPED
jgi:phosphoglycolate phosphatase